MQSKSIQLTALHSDDTQILFVSFEHKARVLGGRDIALQGVGLLTQTRYCAKLVEFHPAGGP